MDALIILSAAILLGFFSGWGFGAAAGLAAGFVLTALYGITLGTTGEEALAQAPTDWLSTLVLGVEYLVGLGAGVWAKSAFGGPSD